MYPSKSEQGKPELTRHHRLGPEQKIRQRGAALILTAVALAALLGFAALAVDIGYLYVVRNQLQNAADAAALSGAGYLTLGPPVPNWETAKTKAAEAISLNKATRTTLTDGQVTYGYWNIKGTPSGLQALPMTPGADDLPALKVSISKSTGQNGGGVELFFARIFGNTSSPLSAFAVAVISAPGSVGPGGLFPVAITKCLFDNYWDSSATPPAPKIDPGTGQPYVFKIGSDYHYGPCDSGQWTSFDLDSDNVPTIRDLINNGNNNTMDINGTTWIEPGTKNTIYNSAEDCSAEGNKACEYVTVPVVINVDAHAPVPVVAFACLHIDRAVGGSDKYIQVEMSNSSQCKTRNAGGTGPYYGASSPPRLAQ